MKGVVFTGFLELVEEKFGLVMVDKIITESNLKSEGIYTSIGVYDFSEITVLINTLSKNINVSVEELHLLFGSHFFYALGKTSQNLFEKFNNPLDILESIDELMYEEVVKLYPKSDLPKFSMQHKTSNTLVMLYQSKRGMPNFWVGLINQVFLSFNKKATVVLDKIKEDGTEVKFTITTTNEQS